MQFAPASRQTSSIDYSKWDALTVSDSDVDSDYDHSPDSQPPRADSPQGREEYTAETLKIFKDERFFEQVKAHNAIGKGLIAEQEKLGLKRKNLASSGEALKQWQSRACANCRTCEDKLITKLQACFSLLVRDASRKKLDLRRQAPFLWAPPPYGAALSRA